MCPLRYLFHKETQELHPETSSLIEAVAKQVELSGIDAWFDLDPAELLGEEADQYEKGHGHPRCLV